MEILQIFLFILFCLLLRIYYKQSNSKKALPPLPPGRWNLPLIGNMHQIVGSSPTRHHYFRDLAKKYGHLMHLQLGETSNVIVTSSEIAKEIFTTHDLVFSGRPDLLAAKIITYHNIDIGFSLDIGPCWKNFRKICTSELLTTKRVRSFRFLREEEVYAFVKDVQSSTGLVINPSEKIFSTISSIVARAAFGGKSRSKDQEDFLSMMDDLVKMLGGFSIVDLFPSVVALQVITGIKAKLERVHRLSDEMLENIIRDHKERKANNVNNNEENLLDVLLKIQQGQDQEFTLTHDHIKAVLPEVFIGGSETPSTTLEWAMAELIRNPSVMEKAQAEVRSVYKGRESVDESEIHELKYLSSVVKETLRLHPPGVLLLPRESTERCVINGYEIPEKTRILVNAWAVGRDPKFWGDEAETFKP